jgi:hypothetical protein
LQFLSRPVASVSRFSISAFQRSCTCQSVLLARSPNVSRDKQRFGPSLKIAAGRCRLPEVRRRQVASVHYACPAAATAKVDDLSLPDAALGVSEP